MSTKRILCILIALLTSGSPTAQACKLPVFRYALERWPVDRYRMVAIVQKTDDANVKEALALLRSADHASINVDIEIIELDTLSEEQLWQIEGIDDLGTTNRLQLFYPARNGTAMKCWEGDLTVANIQSWFDSPLRQALADDLVDGVSAVWILVEGPNRAANDEIAGSLDAALDRAEQEIAIPEGVIARSDADEYLQRNPGASMDDVLRCDVPLRVDFRVRRLSREQADEWAMLAMIRGLTGDEEHPVLVPVFGKGRMLDAMPVEKLNSDTILRACRYMVDECSCTVKALNPGTDLLLSVDWQSVLGTQVIMMDMLDVTTPELVDIPPSTSGEGSTVLAAPVKNGNHRTVALLGSGLVFGALILLAGWFRKRR